jgi:putative peptide zinc metalloprotease protein
VGGSPAAGTWSRRLSADSRLVLRELRITSEGDQHLIGDIARGEFVSVPAIAVTVIEALREGGTLAGTAQKVKARTGTQVDVADFAATLLELGFVARLDGVPLASMSPELTGGGRLGEVAARLAQPFYTRAAFALYGLLFAGCIVALSAAPRLRPHVTQLFFLSNPVLSVALLAAVGMPLAMTHELAHWLGARVTGVPARITISRRYYMLVAQTDLSALWAVPRRRRFPPLLAGIAWDTVRLSVLIAARAAQLAGWWHPSPLLARLIAALIVTHTLSISWQFFIFLRTDIYAVLATGLGCLNLTEISRLWMARRYRKLSPEEAAGLAAASPRDLTAARWYS